MLCLNNVQGSARINNGMLFALKIVGERQLTKFK